MNSAQLQSNPARFHQGALLVRALQERGLPTDVVLSNADHAIGQARLANGTELGLIFPDSFFNRTAALWSLPRSLRFVFIGRLALGRDDMLRSWAARADAVVIKSKWSYTAASKGQYDASYFEWLAKAEFGLCPHEAHWQASKANMWTYRFAECCMTGAIPVQFRRTPLGARFTDGFHYVWDNAAAFTYDPAKAAANRRLAEERFRLP